MKPVHLAKIVIVLTLLAPLVLIKLSEQRAARVYTVAFVSNPLNDGSWIFEVLPDGILWRFAPVFGTPGGLVTSVNFPTSDPAIEGLRPAIAGDPPYSIHVFEWNYLSGFYAAMMIPVFCILAVWIRRKETKNPE